MQENGRRLALVIGVDEAKNAGLSTLHHAISDAQRMAEVLTTQCGFELFRPPLLGDNATSGVVRNAILDLAEEVHPDDELLLYFSGHGQPVMIGARNDTATYLVTSDFSVRHVERDEDSHLSMSWLREQLLRNQPARHVLILLDCCYSEDIRTPGSHYLQELTQRIKEYFDIPGSEEGVQSPGYRAAIAAAGYDQTAGEQEGMGIMTRLLLEALQGNVDDVLLPDGDITINRLEEYLAEKMPPEQKPAFSHSWSGGSQYILAQYPERARELRMKRVPVVREHPLSYTPLLHDPLFQERPHEFEHIEQLLFGSPDGITTKATSARVGLVGITGMGGIGKSQLAAEIAYRYKDRYPGGVFWTPMSGSTTSDWQRQLADLASATDYFPDNDDAANVENQERHARYMCRYLANHADALLILDNVEEPTHLLRYLVTLVGAEIQCSLLYTSRNPYVPTGVQRHTVERLPEDAALRLLLEHRQPLLNETLAGSQSAEAQAARAICKYVDYFPLGLTVLREHVRDDNTMPTYLHAYLHQHGAVYIPDALNDENKAPLFNVFNLSWQKISNEGAQRLFKLAAYFPEAAAIPLSLLGLAANIPGDNRSLDPLGQVRKQLEKWSLIEILANNQIRLHPLIREFGRRLVEQDAQGKAMLQEAGERLVVEFTDIAKLEQRALSEGYWRCLVQVQEVLQYAQVLQPTNIERLESVERWLARDGSLLAADALWPEKIPELVYQQLYNHMVEEGYPLPEIQSSARWIKQNKPVGAESGALLRELKHPDIVTCVAYALDGKAVVTGCEDGMARIWEVSSGQRLAQLVGHSEAISCLSFSPDGTMLVTGSHDATARIWSYRDRETLHILKGHVQEILSVDFSPDGKRIVTTSEDGTFRVWDVATGEEEVNIFHGNLLPLYGLFSADGEQVVTCSEYKAFIWDIKRALVVQEIKEPLEENASFWAVKVIRTQTMTVLITSILRSSDSEKPEIVTRVRNVDSQELVTEVVELDADTSILLSSCYTDSAINRDERRIVLCSNTGLVRVWDIRNGNALMSLEGHTGRVTSFAFSPDGRTIATGSIDRMARIWNVSSGTMMKPAKSSEERIRNLDLSDDGSKLVIGTEQGNIQLWDVVTQEKVSDVSTTCSWINNVTFSKDNKYIVYSTLDELMVGTIDVEQKSIKIIDAKDLVNPSEALLTDVAILSPDNSFIVSSNFQCKIQLRSTQNSRLLYELDHPDGRVFHILFSPDGSKLITASSGGTARVWDMSNYELMAVLKGVVGNVTSLSISGDGKNVALGTVDGSVQIWSLEAKKVLFTLKRRNADTLCTAFSPDGRMLVANDRYAYTSLWSVASRNAGQLLGTYKTYTEINAVRWQDNTHLLMVGRSSSGYRPVFYHLSLEGDWS